MLVEEDGAPIAALPVATFIRTVRLDATGRRLIWTMTWSDGRESDSWLEEVPLDVPPYDTFVLPEATNNSRFGDIESEDEAASLFSMRWWKPAPTARVAAVISTKRLANDLDMIKWRLNKSELDQVNTPEQTRRTVGTHPPATPATRHHSFMWIRWTRRRAQARPPQTSVVCRETHLTSPIRSHRACAHPVSEFVHVTQKTRRERERGHAGHRHSQQDAGCPRYTCRDSLFDICLQSRLVGVFDISRHLPGNAVTRATCREHVGT